MFGSARCISETMKYADLTEVLFWSYYSALNNCGRKNSRKKIRNMKIQVSEKDDQKFIQNSIKTIKTVRNKKPRVHLNKSWQIPVPSECESTRHVERLWRQGTRAPTTVLCLSRLLVLNRSLYSHCPSRYTCRENYALSKQINKENFEPPASTSRRPQESIQVDCTEDTYTRPDCYQQIYCSLAQNLENY